MLSIASQLQLVDYIIITRFLSPTLTLLLVQILYRKHRKPSEGITEGLETSALTVEIEIFILLFISVN